MGKKTKVIINPKKEDLMKEQIQELLRAEIQALRESSKKKLDPVGKEDKDIDNDGDVDSSDKFLHKKRKAISKAIGKDKKEDASELKYDARSKSFKETLRRLGYVKKDSLIYDNKRTGK